MGEIIVFVVIVVGVSVYIAMQISEQRKAREAEESARREAEKGISEAIDDIFKLVEAYKEALHRKRAQLRYKDDYGIIQNDRWHREREYFVQNIIEKQASNLRYLPPERSFLLDTVDNALDCFPPDQVTALNPAALDPLEYEQYCAMMLAESGWQIRMTPATGDQGTDIVASWDGVSMAIQCKKYSSPVGNSAVQEIIAGRAFEGAHYAAVVSNMPFTTSAKQLAAKAGVLLLHHEELSGLREALQMGASQNP